MARFLTRWYAAVTWPEALRLAALDRTPNASIRYAPNAELVHRTEWWAWWADERLTTAIGLPESLCPESLSADAVALISEVWESDSPAPQCGWRTLANVARILNVEPLRLRPQFQEASLSNVWEQMTVEFQAGQEGLLYRFQATYEAGYWCEVRDDFPNSWA